MSNMKITVFADPVCTWCWGSVPGWRALAYLYGNSIELDHVSFSYQENLEVLHDVDLRIQPGETVAVVGSSGGGKSTLCQLIPRFYEVEEGSISIDGVDIRKLTQQSLHRNIGIVQQDVFLVSGSFADNIAYGRNDASFDEIVEAAK